MPRVGGEAVVGTAQYSEESQDFFEDSQGGFPIEKF